MLILFILKKMVQWFFNHIILHYMFFRQSTTISVKKSHEFLSSFYQLLHHHLVYYCCHFGGLMFKKSWILPGLVFEINHPKVISLITYNLQAHVVCHTMFKLVILLLVENLIENSPFIHFCYTFNIAAKTSSYATFRCDFYPLVYLNYWIECMLTCKTLM